MAQIPGYTLRNEDGFEMEYFNPKISELYRELSSMEILSLYLDFRLNSRRKCGHYLEKKFQILSLKNDKVIEGATKSMLMS